MVFLPELLRFRFLWDFELELRRRRRAWNTLQKKRYEVERNVFQICAAPWVDIFRVAKCADEIGDGLLHADPARLVEPLGRGDAKLDLWGVQ